eukprot:623819_1
MAAKDQSIYLNSLDHDSNISRRLSIIRTNPPFSFIPTRNVNVYPNDPIQHTMDGVIAVSMLHVLIYTVQLDEKYDIFRTITVFNIPSS